MSSVEQVAYQIATDFTFFCRTCLTIPARQWRVCPNLAKVKDIPFILAPHQIRYIEYLGRDGINEKCILKTRQRGYSVVTIAYVLWLILYGHNENILYTINSAMKAGEMAALFDRMYRSIPTMFKPKIKIRNHPLNLITYADRNNRLQISTANKDSGRGSSYTMVILDEVASYDQVVQDEIFAAIVASCPNNRVLISTPRRMYDLFHNKTIQSESRDELFVDRFWDDAVSWYGTLENARLWRTTLEQGLTKAQINRELDCEFRGSIEDPVYYNEVEMYKEYNIRGQEVYILSLDIGWVDSTAVLIARDYGSSIHIVDEIITDHQTIPHIVKTIQSKGYNFKYGVVDSSGKKVDQTSGISVHKQIQGLMGLRFRTGKTQKLEMVKFVNTKIAQGLLYVDPVRCPKLKEMIENYEYTKAGKMPHNAYSHIADSLNYLIYNWQTGRRKVKPPTLQARSSFNRWLC